MPISNSAIATTQSGCIRTHDKWLILNWFTRATDRIMWADRAALVQSKWERNHRGLPFPGHDAQLHLHTQGGRYVTFSALLSCDTRAAPNTLTHDNEELPACHCALHPYSFIHSPLYNHMAFNPTMLANHIGYPSSKKQTFRPSLHAQFGTSVVSLVKFQRAETFACFIDTNVASNKPHEQPGELGSLLTAEREHWR